MDKFITRTPKNLKPKLHPSSSNNPTPNEEESSDKRARIEVEVSDDDIIGDPALRKPIDNYPYEIRDKLRRRYLEKGPCQPFGHNFPLTFSGGGSRRFQEAWFKDYTWLEYSVSKDAVFCLYCYLFPKCNKSGENAFTEVGFTNWRKASEKFVAHEGGLKSTHSFARLKCFSYQNQKENIDNVMSVKSDSVKNEYRTRLTAVVDVIRLLLGQGLAFRGHDESEKSVQRGNFLELIKWYCERNEVVNKVMQSNAPKNNQLTSPMIQKEIISACAAETRRVILNEIGDKRFSLLIDEARDSSAKEQMAVVLRFVNDGGEVIERFLGVVHVSDTSAHCLKNAIDDFFAKNGLSLSRLRGQGYDGASNMRGELNGLKRLILNENKHPHYIHCFAHQLQLVVVAAAGAHGEVCTFFDYLSMIVNIAGASCKRKDALLQLQHDEVVKQLERGEISTGRGKNQEKSLSRPGDTRWGSHYKTILRVFDMWNPIKDVLLNVYKDGTDQKSRATAGSLVDKMFSFEFVFIARLMMNLLAMTNALSKILQEKDQNIGNVVRMIKVVKNNLQAYRKDSWEEFLEEVTGFCSTNEIHVPNMEDTISGRGKRLLHGESRTYLHHFRVETFIQVIDLIAQEMDNRFTESNSELLLCISCLDPINSFANFDHERLLRLAKLYSEDFSSCDLLELQHQLKQYISDMRSNATFAGLLDIGALVKKMVENKYHTIFRLVYRLIELALILPVATATVERCFSAMNIVKTDLRNQMGDDYLTDCLVCYIEKRIFSNIENEVIMEHFQNMGSRRNLLPPVSYSRIASASSVNEN